MFLFFFSINIDWVEWKMPDDWLYVKSINITQRNYWFEIWTKYWSFYAKTLMIFNHKIHRCPELYHYILKEKKINNIELFIQGPPTYTIEIFSRAIIYNFLHLVILMDDIRNRTTCMSLLQKLIGCIYICEKKKNWNGMDWI